MLQPKFDFFLQKVLIIPFHRELEEEKKEAEMMGLNFSKEGELMAVQKKLMMTEKAMMMEKQMMMFKQKQMMMNKQKAMMMRRQQEKMLKKKSQKQPEITRLQHQARISTQKSFQSVQHSHNYHTYQLPLQMHIRKAKQ